ncbi:uncharacterized protein C14orf119 [Sitophilus oryzae]|uniref:Uncharacterized protein C14orf119 n=1 Tax=Sitophilus oryzae TaxID=7048 RepID=A0A6J2XBH3_SITOR|nr:uncharacterized protein C14orf119 [Sitophilus oryzae]
MCSLSTEAQIRYLLQWFQEWSELQKSDFLLVLADNYAHKAYVNGIVNSIANINCRDKPMSIFECRIKLFKEWFTQWNIEQKDTFLKKLGDIDPNFMEKLNAEIEKNDKLHADETISNDNS